MSSIYTEGAAKVGNGFFTIVKKGTFVWDPASLIDGAGETSADVPAAGAAFGDFVLIAAPAALVGAMVTGHVKSAGVIVARLQNESGATLDMATGTWKYMVLR